MTSVAHNVLRYPAITALCAFPVITHGQSVSQQSTPSRTNAPLDSSTSANRVDKHKYVGNLALLSRQGDPPATAELAQYIFSVVAVPAELANALHLTQRVAQAETDYRNGAQTAVHEADLVRAHNNLVNSLQLPEWVSTSADELRTVHMDFALGYPEFLADHAAIDKSGRLSLLSDDLSPTQAMFLETSLLFQKFHNSKFQITVADRAGGRTKTLSPLILAERRNYIGLISRGKFDNVSTSDLNHAIDNLFSDLKMSNSLRSEFDKPDLLSALNAGRESK